MKYSMRSGWGLTFAVLTMLLLSACTINPPRKPTVTVVPPKPALTLEPASGVVGSQLAITGAGFPSATVVRIQMGASSDVREPQFIGEVKTDAAGTFRLAFVLPARWSDGQDISEPKLVFTSISLDGAVRTTATYNCISATEAATLPAVQSTPRIPTIFLDPAAGGTQTRVNIRASMFPANRSLQVHLGLLGAGAGASVYSEGITNDAGDSNMSITIPELWPDGHELKESTLVVLVSTQDGSASATALFNLDVSVVEVNGTQVAPLSQTATVAASEQEATDGASKVITSTSLKTADYIQVVIDFLNALLRDPTGTTTIPYLSQRMRSEINSDWSLPTGLGIQPGYTSFEVAMLAVGELKADVRATLTYESGASVRNFAMVMEEGAWRIDSVIAGSQ